MEIAMRWCGFTLLMFLAGESAGLAADVDPLNATIPALINALKDPDRQVRTLAASALVHLDERAVPALVKLLEGEDRALKVQAAAILGSMSLQGRRHVAALPAMLKLLEDKDVKVRRSAVAAMSGIAVKALEKAPAADPSVSTVTGPAAGADDAFEVKVVKLVGTLRKLEPRELPPGGPQYEVFFVDVKLKGGVVKQQVDFGGGAELEKQAAGCVGKRVSIDGRAECRVVKKGLSAELDEVGLVVTVTKMSLVADK